MTEFLKRHVVSFLVCFTTAVWVFNGLFCKILGLVPRHELIVAHILGPGHAFLITKAIGCGEVLMAVWILSRIKPGWSSLAQIILVATMNILEFILAPDILLFGRFNIVIASLFILFLLYVEHLRTNQLEVIST